MTHPLHYCWVTEANGLGPAYRTWLGLPDGLPLPFYGDHGVCYLGRLDASERSSRPRIHTTWGRSREAQLRRDPAGKTIVRIPCPWIMYRRLLGIERRPDARGTLIFMPHSLPNTELELALEDYVGRVVGDPRFPAPHTLVVHPHDMAKGLGERLESSGWNVHCFGSSHEPAFIANFYAAASRHTHAVSCRPGSELHYCHELGLVYRQVDGAIEERSLDERIATTRALQAQDALTARLLDRQRMLFHADGSASDRERDAFVADTLSLDLATDAMRQDFRALVLERLLPETMSWLFEVGGRVASRIRRVLQTP